MSTTETTTPAMTTDWAAHLVEPGTQYDDEPKQMVQPGWYVLGASEDEGSDVVIYVEEALDVEANDIREYVAKLIAERLRGVETQRMYGQALKETAKVIGYIGIPEVIPDKVRELVERLRTEIAAVRANFAFERRVADVNDKEWSAADDECTQLRADLIERTRERDAAHAQAKGFAEIATTITEQHDGLKSEVARLTADFERVEDIPSLPLLSREDLYRMVIEERARSRYFASRSDGFHAERDDAREEIAKLQHALSVAEPHEADVRLDVERDVRAELAEKAGA